MTGPLKPCACGCGQVVTGRGRYATRRCWSRTQSATWTPQRKQARAQKGGLARWAKHPAMSATSRFL